MKVHQNSGLFIILGILSWGLSGVRALVETEAVCSSNSTFLYNSLGQSPCLVAAYLLSACTDGDWDLPALDSNNTGYQASTGNGTYVPCICTTVVYSLASGCSICQLGATVFSTWSGYSSACTVVYDRQLPMGIPAGTAVPSWAYQDVMAKGIFDLAVVNVTTAPDSTVAVNGPTSASSISSPSTRTSSSSSTSTETIIVTPAPNSSKSSNAGAIAGGVVGGVVGLAIIGLIIFLLVRHQKKTRSEKDGGSAGASVGGGMSAGSHTPSLGGYYGGGGSPSMVQYATPVSSGFGAPPTPNSGAPLLGGQKVYNPDDPSTYPTPVESHYYNAAHTTENRAYRGFPEV